MRSLPRRVMTRVCLLTITTLVASLGVLLPAQASDASTVVGGGTLGGRGIQVHLNSAVPSLPPISATSFVIADATTGRILAADNAHERLAPASTLKTLTAVTLIPRLYPYGTIKGSVAAADTEPTRVGIIAGATYRVSNLFTAMLMMSANDAAVSIADAEGGLAPALTRMNAEAAHLHANDTVAKTPNGLDAAGQTSSAYDLSLIFRAGLSMPSFRHYLSLRSASFPLGNGTTVEMYTHDRLLADYPGMIAGKNGYTSIADGTFVGAATRGGHTIIVAVMHDQPNFWPEVETLLSWGFAADGRVTSVGSLVAPG